MRGQETQTLIIKIKPEKVIILSIAFVFKLVSDVILGTTPKREGGLCITIEELRAVMTSETKRKAEMLQKAIASQFTLINVSPLLSCHIDHKHKH